MTSPEGSVRMQHERDHRPPALSHVGKLSEGLYQEIAALHAGPCDKVIGGIHGTYEGNLGPQWYSE